MNTTFTPDYASPPGEMLAETIAHVSGAARQITDDVALIVQTRRYKDDGHFWLTFFHEARHVLQGKLQREWLVEYDPSPP
jgi:hypothetical protein